MTRYIIVIRSIASGYRQHRCDSDDQHYESNIHYFIVHQHRHASDDNEPTYCFKSRIVYATQQ
jgi:hypothetical protein